MKKRVPLYCIFTFYLLRLFSQSSIDSINLISQKIIEDTLYTYRFNIDSYPGYTIIDKYVAERYLYDSIPRLYKVVKIERLTDIYLISIVAIKDKQQYAYTIISFFEDTENRDRYIIKEGEIYLLTLYKTDDYNRSRDVYHTTIDMYVDNKRIFILDNKILKYRLVTCPDIKGLYILDKERIIIDN